MSYAVSSGSFLVTSDLADASAKSGVAAWMVFWCCLRSAGRWLCCPVCCGRCSGGAWGFPCCLCCLCRCWCLAPRLPRVNPIDTEEVRASFHFGLDASPPDLAGSLAMPVPKFKTPMGRETVAVNAQAGKTTRLDILPSTGDRYYQPAGPKYVSTLAASRTAIMDDKNEMKSLLRSVLKTSEHQTADDKARVASYKPYGPVWSAHVRKLKEERAMPVGKREMSPLYRFYTQTPPRGRTPASRGKRGQSCPPYPVSRQELYSLTEPHTNYTKSVQKPKTSCMRGLMGTPTGTSQGSLPQLSVAENHRTTTPSSYFEHRSYQSFTSGLPEYLGHL